MMNNSDRKLPLWSKIFIAVILLLMIIGIFFIIKIHSTYYTYSEDVPPVGLIITIIITGTIAIANVILVGFTKIYTDQTTRMAKETADMVRYYRYRWRFDLQPFFIPIGSDYNDNNNFTFKFKNFGDLALFVQCGIMAKLYKECKYVKEGETIELQVTDMDELICSTVVMDINNPDDSVMALITIDFQDRLTTKYRQNFHFYFKKSKWDFDFNESCLPIEQPKKPS